MCSSDSTLSRSNMYGVRRASFIDANTLNLTVGAFAALLPYSIK